MKKYLKRCAAMLLLVALAGVGVFAILSKDASADNEVTLLWTQPNDANDPLSNTTGIFKAQDGGYFVTGQDSSNVAMVVKLDANGNKLWSAKSSDASSMYTSVVETSASEFVAVGYSTDGEAYAILNKFQISNNTAVMTEELSYDVGDNLETTFGTILIDDDDNFVIAGASQNSNGNNRVVFVMKLARNHSCTVDANNSSNRTFCDEDVVYKVEGSSTKGWGAYIYWTITKMVKLNDDTYLIPTGSTSSRDNGLIKVEESNNSEARIVFEGGGMNQTSTAGSMSVASAADGEYMLAKRLLGGYMPITVYSEMTNGDNHFLWINGGIWGDFMSTAQPRYVVDQINYASYYQSIGIIPTNDGEYLVYGGITDTNATYSNSTLTKVNGATYEVIWETTGDIGIKNEGNYLFIGVVADGNGIYTAVDNKGVVRQYQDNTSYHHISYHIVGNSPFGEDYDNTSSYCHQKVRTSAAAGTTFGELENYSECMQTIYSSNYTALDSANYIAGYTFDGWYTDDTFTTKFTEENIIADRDINLYGRYTKKSYEIPFYIATYDSADSDPEYTLISTQTASVGDAIEFPSNVTPEGDGWEEPDGWYGVVIDGDSKTINTAIKTDENQNPILASANIMLKEKAKINPDALVGQEGGGTPIQEHYYDGLVMKFVRQTNTVSYNFTGNGCYPSGNYIRSGTETVAYGGTFDVGPVITEDKQCYLTNLQSSTDGTNWIGFNPATPITEDTQVKGEWMQNYLVVKDDELQYADGTAFNTSDAGGIEYNPSTNTLALNNYVSEIGSSYCASGAYEVEFSCFLPVKIENGDDPVTVIFNGVNNDLSKGGLHSTSPLILDGDGELSTLNSYTRDITSTSSIVIEGGKYYCYEMVAVGNLIVNGGEYDCSRTVVEPNNNGVANLVIKDGDFDSSYISMNGSENNFTVDDGHVELEEIRLEGEGDNKDLNVLVEDGEVFITGVEDTLRTKNFIIDGGEVYAMGYVKAEHLEVNDGELTISPIYPMEAALEITGTAEFNGGTTTISGGRTPIMVEPEGEIDGPLVSFNGGDVTIKVLKDTDAVLSYIVDSQIEMFRPEIEEEMHIQEQKDAVAAMSDEEISQGCSASLSDINEMRTAVGMDPYENADECAANLKADYPAMMDGMLEAQLEYYRQMLEQEVENMRPQIESMMAQVTPAPIAILADDESAISIAEYMERDAFDTIDGESERKPLTVAKGSMRMGGQSMAFITFSNGDGDPSIDAVFDEDTGEFAGYNATNIPLMAHIYAKETPPVPDTDPDDAGDEESDDESNPGASDTGLPQFDSSAVIGSSLISVAVMGIAGIMLIVYRRNRQSK
ncbi:InlB B-repeat-containing protein [Candidatus Saccharibacteria bacterium]|nr:InlB B-repeat-containing protein [Candidatus Saccharibacteria bacterium]